MENLFNYNWEQRKLGEVVESVGTGRSTFTNGIVQTSETPYAVLGSTSVISYDSMFDHSGDFILTARVGANAGNLYKYFGEVKISDNTVYIQANNLDFIYYLLTKYDLKRLSFGTGQPLVKASEVKNLKLNFPQKNEEQQKIGSFFKQLDDTIALHQRKLDQLKELKTAYLQVIFPVKDERVPKLRFADFEEEWELCKLGDLANIVGGGTPNTNNPKCWDGNIDWYAPAEIKEKIYVTGSKKRITELGLQKSSAKVLPIGTVLFTSRAGIGNTAILAKKGTTNQGFQSIIPNKNKLDTYFIFSRTHELKKYGEAVGAGSTFVEVSGKQMAKMPMLTPRFNEQQAIGMFFKKIDDIITLHQNKLEQLKDLKTSYLQNMFI